MGCQEIDRERKYEKIIKKGELHELLYRETVKSVTTRDSPPQLASEVKCLLILKEEAEAAESARKCF